MSNNMQHFDVKTVSLSGKNLVEASAGTGKTYSIAILVLRMIIEKDISIDKQLIVTFTNFAVAELQERIRLFVKQAYDIVSRTASQDEALKDKDDAVIRSICLPEKNNPALQEKLRAALLLIDEANILTIHGFCQKMLREYAFETKQNFQATLQNDVSEFIDQISNQFWRKELSNLPIGLFEPSELLNIKNNLKTILQKAIGNVYLSIEENLKSKENVTQLQNAIVDVDKSLLEQEAYMIRYIEENTEAIKEDVSTNTHAKKKYSALLDDKTTFYNEAKAVYVLRKLPAFYSKLKSPIWTYLENYINTIDSLKTVKDNYAKHLYHIGLTEYLPQLQYNIQKGNILTFDAMIIKMHQAIVIENNQNLCRLIRQAFPVAFIDEFQDTDVIQFELFYKLFVEKDEKADTTLFLIGDPKQSIYAFRNADVTSYLKAANNIEKVYTMNTNFRSSEQMISAANYFFNASGDSIFGYLETDQEKIQYQKVNAHHKFRKLLNGDEEIKHTLQFAGFDKKENAINGLVNTIADLLDPDNPMMIQLDKDTIRAIQPEDIAILTTSKSDGLEIKQALHQKNIPAVNIDDKKVLQSKEAKDLSLILQAMINPTINNVKAALYLSFLHSIYSVDNNAAIPLFAMDEIEMIALFNSYHQLINEQSVYQALLKLFKDFSVQQNLSKTFASQRILANLLQLAELFHQQQYRRELSADKLWLWLKQAINDNSVQGDEYIMQIESDEQAVNILTIHKSKGLEYPIVFVYGIHKKTELRNDGLIEIKTEEGKRILKLGTDISQEEEDELLLHSRQENRRLIYVAITRAALQCYVFYTGTSGFNNSELNALMHPLENIEGINLDFEAPSQSSNYQLQAAKQKHIKSISFSNDQANKSKSNWSLASFSGLAIKHVYEPKLNSNDLNEYDQFIFNTLPRGADAGTMLHEIFEKIDFTKDYSDVSKWNGFEKRLLSQFDRKDAKKETKYDKQMAQLIGNVMQANIVLEDNNFNLNQIKFDKRLNELAFDFPINQDDIKQNIWPLLETYQTGFNDKYFNLSGIMTGFIDLLFEHNGKYYILDWKSNYLGYTIEDYEGENLKTAMINQQYTLQYLIYTLAVHKFLKQRLGAKYNYDEHFGGVVYIFLRGVRANSDAGIYTDRPSLAFIEKLEQAMGNVAVA